MGRHVCPRFCHICPVLKAVAKDSAPEDQAHDWCMPFCMGGAIGGLAYCHCVPERPRHDCPGCECDPIRSQPKEVEVTA